MTPRLVPLRVVLGPMPCQGCKRLVVWTGQDMRTLPESSRRVDGLASRPHRCVARRAAA